jgi:hypothetical protein
MDPITAFGELVRRAEPRDASAEDRYCLRHSVILRRAE